MPDTPESNSPNAPLDGRKNLLRLFVVEEGEDAAEAQIENDAPTVHMNDAILEAFDSLMEQTQENPDTYPEALLALMANVKSIHHNFQAVFLCAASCADEASEETGIVLKALRVVLQKTVDETGLMLRELQDNETASFEDDADEEGASTEFAQTVPIHDAILDAFEELWKATQNNAEEYPAALLALMVIEQSTTHSINAVLHCAPQSASETSDGTAITLQALSAILQKADTEIVTLLSELRDGASD